MNAAEIKVSIGGRDFVLSTGKVAKQSEGAVMVRYGDTVVLCTSNSGPSRSSDFSFFPLTVEYRERSYSAGKIPGGFFKREGKPRDSEILSARIIDRSIRPLFPWNLMNEVQVMVFSLSFDLENDPDVMSINGASASLMCTGIPFGGPVGAVRVGKIDGKIQCRLTADGWQECKFSRRFARAASTQHLGFNANDLFDVLMRERLDVGAVGQVGVGHDGGRVRVHQHNLVALLLEGLAGLRAGVVELRRLADDDRPRADHQNLLNVISAWHVVLSIP